MQISTDYLLLPRSPRLVTTLKTSALPNRSLPCKSAPITLQWHALAHFLRIVLGLFIIKLLFFATPANAQTITTIAGSSQVGDGGPATSARLDPYGIAVDRVGNLFIADRDNYRIRKVATDGTITTVAGTGLPGSGGDNGPATSARLYAPSDVAMDGRGNLFIADSGNHRIRKVSSDGTITTVAGNGSYGYRGDGGPATSAWLAYPTGVAVDGMGNLFITDRENQRIRKVTTDGIITTVAGTAGFGGDNGPATSASLNSPSGIVVDTLGNLLIADSQNNRIRKLAPDGILTTVAGNGTAGFSGDNGLAINARLNHASGITVDRIGNLFIADNDNNRVRKVAPSGIVTTVAGSGIRDFAGDNGPATSAALNSPTSIAVDVTGNLYVADPGNDRIRLVINPIYTLKSGNWNDPSVWSCMCIPTKSVDVLIKSEHKVLLDNGITKVICRKLTLLGTLSMQSNSITINGAN